jgi:hypothetical protein
MTTALQRNADPVIQKQKIERIQEKVTRMDNRLRWLRVDEQSDAFGFISKAEFDELCTMMKDLLVKGDTHIVGNLIVDGDMTNKGQSTFENDIIVPIPSSVLVPYVRLPNSVTIATSDIALGSYIRFRALVDSALYLRASADGGSTFNSSFFKSGRYYTYASGDWTTAPATYTGTSDEIVSDTNLWAGFVNMVDMTIFHNKVGELLIRCIFRKVQSDSYPGEDRELILHLVSKTHIQFHKSGDIDFDIDGAFELLNKDFKPL